MLWCQRVEFLMQIVIPYLCDVESQRRTIFISNYQKLGFGVKCLERVLALFEHEQSLSVSHYVRGEAFWYRRKTHVFY